jgi:choline dehydrogenase-like flavoprotein
MNGAPLPRAVDGCEGCADCITGCAGGHKQSVDRSYLPHAIADGADVYSCASAERILVEGTRAAGVAGTIIDPSTYQKVARFTVRAKKIVLAAGTMHTPCLLLASGIDANHTAGSTLFAHIGGGIVGMMEEVVDPWIGATQGWGAMSDEIRGMKFESLWASPSLIMVRWGDVGMRFLERLGEIKHAAVIALVYRADMKGSVRPKWNGLPSMRLWIPDHETQVVLRGMKMAADALLKVGARFVYTGIPGTKEQMRTEDDTRAMLNPKLRFRDIPMTANHVFGSCRMSKFDDGTVDLEGKVRGIDDLYIADASIFPSPSAVNPQATIMALADVITRRLGELR